MTGFTIEGLDMSGADPDSWGFVAMINSQFSDPPPKGVYLCTACGRDWMRHYDQCPMCDHAPLVPNQADRTDLTGGSS